jgi:hypothetical protein
MSRDDARVVVFQREGTAAGGLSRAESRGLSRAESTEPSRSRTGSFKAALAPARPITGFDRRTESGVRGTAGGVTSGASSSIDRSLKSGKSNALVIGRG